MAVEGQPLLPARPPPGSKKGLVAWLRSSPILAFVLVAVFVAGLLSHIARSDAAQSVTALTQRAAGGARWGSKTAASLPAQDDTAAEDEDEPEEGQEVQKPGGLPGNPTDSAAAAHSSDAAAAQQEATTGDATPSQGGDGGNQQPADGSGLADGAAGGQQQVGGEAAGTQPAAEADAQPAGSGEQQQTPQQNPPAAELTLEEVRASAMMSQPAPKIPRETDRKTLAKIVVLPVHPCQVVGDVLQNKCMYGGREAVTEPDCVEAIAGESQNAYLTPFVRVQPVMGAGGIKKYSVAPVWTDSMGDEARGAWQSAVAAADIVVLNELAYERHRDQLQDKRLILLTSDASATLSTCNAPALCAQTLLQDDRVLAFFQHTSLQPLTANNAARHSGRVHLDLLSRGRAQPADAVSLQIPETGPFTEQMLAKVKTIIPLAWSLRFPVSCQSRLQEWVEWAMPLLQGGVGDFPGAVKPIFQRSHDVMFVSTSASQTDSRSSAEEQELVQSHRETLQAKLNELQSSGEISVKAGKVATHGEYAELLRDSRVVISPLGASGEYTWMDYEATLSRAVLVKPLASSLTSYPDIYEEGVTCVSVSSDFRDLDAVVKGLLADEPKMQRIADAGYQRLLQHVQERRFAYDLGQVLLKVVEDFMPEQVIPP